MELSLLETIRYALGVLRRRWYLFVISVVVISAASLAIAVLLPPVYVSTARILIESQQIPKEFVRSSVTSAANERIQVIQQRVMTRSNLLTIVRKFEMQKDELANHSSTQIVEYMRQRLKISKFSLQEGRRRNAATIAFTISFENRNPQRAAAITNELVTLILAEDARTRRTQASDTSKFLAEEAVRLEKELGDLEAQIAAYKEENKAALPEKLVYNLSEVSSLRLKISQIDNNLRKAREDMKIARLEMSGSTGPGAAGQIQAQLQKLRNDLVLAKAVFSASHPQRKLLENRIETLEKKVLDDAAQVADTLTEQNDRQSNTSADGEPSNADIRTSVTLEILQDRIDRNISTKEELQRQIDELNVTIGKVPQVELGLTTLSRRLEINKTKLQQMWSKYAEAQLGERLEAAQKGERFEVIEQPTVPTEPERPNRLLVLGLGVFVAFGVGGAGLGLPEGLDPSIRSVKQLSTGLGLRPLVVIPFFITPEERRLKKRRQYLILILMSVLFFTAIVSLHLLYMPIDLLISKIVQRFQV